MILGAMKCGTTTLFSLLARHPNISFCKTKETDFFANTKNWSKNINRYKKHFKIQKNAIYGEASTSYTAFPEYNLNIADILYDYNSDLKHIYIMRNPVERALSHYMHFYARKYIKYDLMEALYKMPSLINRGRYYMQIKPFIEKFGKEKVKLIVFEDFINDQSTYMKDICSFIGVDFEAFGQFKPHHGNPTEGKKRRDYKLDKYYHFIYENKIGKSIRNVIPDFLRKTGNRILEKTSGSFDVKIEMPYEFQQIVYRLSLNDIIKIEELVGRRIPEWHKYPKTTIK